MSDFKSKLPDLSEIGSMASKLFKDVSKSVGEIITDYKEKRENQDEPVKQQAKETKETNQQKEQPDTETAEKENNKDGK